MRPGSTMSAWSSSSTSPPALSSPTCSRPSRSRFAATTFALRGCSAASTSTSSCSSTSTGSTAARRRVRPVVRARALPAARRDASHAALGAGAAPARGALGAVPGGRARDRDDRDRAPPPDRPERLPGGKDPDRAARRAGCDRAEACRAGRGAEAGVRHSRRRQLRGDSVALSAVHVRPPLGRQGTGDGAGSDARDRGAASGCPVPDRRAHPPAGRATRGREVPPGARAPRRRSGARGSRRVRRPIPVDRRAGRPARRDRRLRDPVPQPRADRLRRAHLRARRRLRRGLDPVLVRRGRSRIGRGSRRAVRRPAGSRGRGLRLHRAAGIARSRQAGGAADRLRAPLVVGGRSHRRGPP